MSNFWSDGDCEHAGHILEWITQQQDDVPEGRFDVIAMQRRWGSDKQETKEVREVLVHGIEQSHRRNVASIGEKRTTQRWSERLETIAHGVSASDQCDSTRIHEEIAGNSSHGKHIES